MWIQVGPFPPNPKHKTISNGGPTHLKPPQAILRQSKENCQSLAHKPNQLDWSKWISLHEPNILWSIFKVRGVSKGKKLMHWWSATKKCQSFHYELGKQMKSNRFFSLANQFFLSRISVAHHAMRKQNGAKCIHGQENPLLAAESCY